jgi:hypothetical protein
MIMYSPCKYDAYATIRIDEPCGRVLGEVSRLLEASGDLKPLVVSTPSTTSTTSDDSKALIAANAEVYMLAGRLYYCIDD